MHEQMSGVFPPEVCPNLTCNFVRSVACHWFATESERAFNEVKLESKK